MAPQVRRPGRWRPPATTPSRRGPPAWRTPHHRRAAHHRGERLPLQGTGAIHQLASLGLGLAGVGEALATAPLRALPSGIAHELVGLVEQFPGEHAVGVLLHQEVEGVLLEVRQDARRVPDPNGVEAGVETQLEE